jgi:hypothetical protein
LIIGIVLSIASKLDLDIFRRKIPHFLHISFFCCTFAAAKVS